MSRSSASRSDVEDEYVTISVSSRADEPIPITGFRLVSTMTGKSTTIGNAVTTFISGLSTLGVPLRLAPGERATIATGRSPVGASFKINICSGYLEQFQDFTPRISRRCPRAENDPNVQTGPSGFSDQCLDYIDRISSCIVPINPPEGLGFKCYEFMNANLNYNKCVEKHKNDSNFFDDEWRIYLGGDHELWKSKREIIKLIDTEGKIVDEITY